ncbi:hypothetical protein C2E23DRAFT_725038, partial [Lenzites betulinus]
RPQNYKELYNLQHTSARNVIERIFGVVTRCSHLMVEAAEYSLQLHRGGGGVSELVRLLLKLALRLQAPADVVSNFYYKPTSLTQGFELCGMSDKHQRDVSDTYRRRRGVPIPIRTVYSPVACRPSTKAEILLYKANPRVCHFARGLFV